MKVAACSGIGLSSNRNLSFKRGNKCCASPPAVAHESQFEFDYAKCLKQMSYILGMTVIGIAGIVLAIKGKKR